MGDKAKNIYTINFKELSDLEHFIKNDSLPQPIFNKNRLDGHIERTLVEFTWEKARGGIVLTSFPRFTNIFHIHSLWG